MTDTVLLAVEQAGTGEVVTFWLLAPLAALGAIGMVAARNAVHSALWLVLTMLSLGVFYVVQSAPFLGAAQIVVYTGAIMMLFLFVLMLVGRDASDSLIETLRGQRVAAVVLGAGFATLIGTGLYRATKDAPVAGLAEPNAAYGGNVQGLANQIFADWVAAFEVTGALLVTAVLGGMLLAHIVRARGERRTQPDMMRARFAPGSYPGMKAGPGVYATSTSIAVPAKLPDGTPAQRSISPILPVRELTSAETAPKGTDK